MRGEPATLTAKEFDLLHYLMAHAGEVFSRDDLLDAVWDRNFVGGPATVTVHIRRLREKIERDPEPAEPPESGLGHGLQVRSVGVNARRQSGSGRGDASWLRGPLRASRCCAGRHAAGSRDRAWRWSSADRIFGAPRRDVELLALFLTASGVLSLVFGALVIRWAGRAHRQRAAAPGAGLRRRPAGGRWSTC